MIGKIEISRELAERLADFLEDHVFGSAIEVELRALLAAPAVERQEPVEWRYRFTHRGETSKWFPVDSYMKLYNIGNDPAYEIQPLYTSPPAPVAVVLPSKQEISSLVWNEVLKAGAIPGVSCFNAADLAVAIRRIAKLQKPVRATK